MYPTCLAESLAYAESAYTRHLRKILARFLPQGFRTVLSHTPTLKSHSESQDFAATASPAASKLSNRLRKVSQSSFAMLCAHQQQRCSSACNRSGLAQAIVSADEPASGRQIDLLTLLCVFLNPSCTGGSFEGLSIARSGGALGRNWVRRRHVTRRVQVCLIASLAVVVVPARRLTASSGSPTLTAKVKLSNAPTCALVCSMWSCPLTNISLEVSVTEHPNTAASQCARRVS